MSLRVEQHTQSDLYKKENNKKEIQNSSLSCFPNITNPINVDTFELSKSKEEDSTDFSTIALGVGATVLSLGGLALALKFKNKLPFTKVVSQEGYSYTRGLFGKKLNLKPSSVEKYKEIAISNNSLISQRIKNPQPTNLFNELKRCDYHEYELKNLLGRNPNLSRFVGSLPPSWAKRFKSSEATQKIDDVLTNYAKEFHAVKEGNLPNTAKLQQELSEIIETNVEITSLGYGAVGNVYKIKAFDEEYAFKVFFNKPCLNINSYGHGNYPELLSAIKASRYHTKDFAKFYMGKFGKDNDGYLLTKYIPKGETEKSLKKLKHYSFNFNDQMKKLGSGDYKSDNVRNGIILDYGATSNTKYVYLSPKAEKIARELFPALDGKSPDKVAKIAEKYTSTKEFEEVKNYINYLIENHYAIGDEFFRSKKEHLAKIGLDFKPNINKLFSSNASLEPYATDYGLTAREMEGLRNTYAHSLVE